MKISHNITHIKEILMKYNIDFSNYDKRPLYFRDLKAGDLFIPVDDPETFILI